VRTPGEIAADCEGMATAVRNRIVVSELSALLREAAGALRRTGQRHRDVVAAEMAAEAEHELARRAEADRDALLAVARYAEHSSWRCDPTLKNPGCACGLDDALAALPEHLRRQVER
jgi:hypothetical protein